MAVVMKKKERVNIIVLVESSISRRDGRTMEVLSKMVGGRIVEVDCYAFSLVAQKFKRQGSANKY